MSTTRRSKTPKGLERRTAESAAVYTVAAPAPPPALTRVTRHGQITLPSDVRRGLGIEEGDLIQVEIAGDRIMLTPKRLVDKSQAYFWTREWQAAEAEAEADIRAGRVRRFASAKNLLKDLDA